MEFNLRENVLRVIIREKREDSLIKNALTLKCTVLVTFSTSDIVFEQYQSKKKKRGQKTNGYENQLIYIRRIVVCQMMQVDTVIRGPLCK